MSIHRIGDTKWHVVRACGGSHYWVIFIAEFDEEEGWIPHPEHADLVKRAMKGSRKANEALLKDVQRVSEIVKKTGT